MGERSKRKSSRPREWETLKTQVEPLPRMGNAQNTSRAAPRMGNAQNAGRAAPENGKRSKRKSSRPENGERSKTNLRTKFRGRAVESVTASSRRIKGKMFQPRKAVAV